MGSAAGAAAAVAAATAAAAAGGGGSSSLFGWPQRRQYVWPVSASGSQPVSNVIRKQHHSGSMASAETAQKGIKNIHGGFQPPILGHPIIVVPGTQWGSKRISCDSAVDSKKQRQH